MRVCHCCDIGMLKGEAILILVLASITDSILIRENNRIRNLSFRTNRAIPSHSLSGSLGLFPDFYAGDAKLVSTFAPRAISRLL